MNSLFKIASIALCLFTGDIFSAAFVFNQEVVEYPDNIHLVISSETRDEQQLLFKLEIQTTHQIIKDYYTEFGREKRIIFNEEQPFAAFLAKRLDFLDDYNCSLISSEIHENVIDNSFWENLCLLMKDPIYYS